MREAGSRLHVLEHDVDAEGEPGPGGAAGALCRLKGALAVAPGSRPPDRGESTGCFSRTDPVAGGSANAYDYANQDPVNQGDRLDRVLRGEADETLAAAQSGSETEEAQVVAGISLVTRAESAVAGQPGVRSTTHRWRPDCSLDSIPSRAIRTPMRFPRSHFRR